MGRVTGKLVYFSLYSISYGIRSTVSGLLQSKAVYSVYCAFSFSAQVFNSISSRIITLFLSFQLGLSKVATFIAPYCFALIVPVVCLSFFSNFQSIYAFYGLNNLAFFAASFNVSNWPRFLTSLFLNLISNIYKGACGFILTKAVDSWSKPWGILKAPAYIFLFVLSVLPHALFIERRIIRADKLFSVDATLLQNILLTASNFSVGTLIFDKLFLSTNSTENDLDCDLDSEFDLNTDLAPEKKVVRKP